MVKRIVSGIFILTALGALGVILAGAMTSGEQLIVRFLTAVTVAALALYVISDLRLQNEQVEPPTERDRQHADRSAAKSTAAESAVTTFRRRGGFVRRGRDSSEQPAPNFEAIEPVTARSRPVALADPTEAVTGSRLVPQGPEQAERIVPPHPTTGSLAEYRDQPAPSTSTPASTPPIPPDSARRIQVDTGSEHRLDEDADGVVERVVEELSDNRVDSKAGFLTPPDERPPASPSSSVIANTSYTYSGKLDSVGVEWPPKPPPETDDPGGQHESGKSGEPVSAMDAPTAELPALTGLTAFGTEEDQLLPAFAPEIANWEHGDRSESDTSDPAAHLFAIETADLFLTEPGGSEVSETQESTDDADRAPSTDEDSSVADSAASDAGSADSPPTWSSQPEPATPLVRRIEAAQYATPPRTDHLDLGGADLVTTGDLDRPVPAAHPAGSAAPDKLTAAIRSGEVQVINSLISQGMLSTTGPITDRDVRTMVYVAFTSNELRKLILAGGTPDGIRAGDLDLGDVELFDESRFAPPPKLLYSGPQDQSDAIIDLVALENKSAVAGSSDSGTEHDLGLDDDADLVPTLPTPSHLYRRAAADRVER